MKIMKFGGSSVANPKHIEQVKNIVEQQSGLRILVVSALGGITDLLLQTAQLAAHQDKGYKTILQEVEKRHLEAAKELLPVGEQSKVLSHLKGELNILETLLDGAFLIGEITPKLSDKIVSYGELLSSYLISSYLISKGLDAVYQDSRELIITDDLHGKATVLFEATQAKCDTYFSGVSHDIVVLGGFIAASEAGDTTTLGRGGSDYTASILAAALKASVLEIWTDVSGMYTADPKWVKQAKAIPELSYQEAMELSHFGAKVLYPPTIQPVLAKGIPVHIKNTFDPELPGTRIAEQRSNGKTVRGISHIGQIALLSLEGSGMVGIPGISKRFFEVLSLAGVSVVLITQASSEHSICIGISSTDVPKAEVAINSEFAYEIAQNKIKPVLTEEHLAIVALVGDNMKSHQGLSGKMFSTLGYNNVNIRAIAQGASERNISAVIAEKDVKKALNALHERFFEGDIKQLNLFVMGVGNVGSKLLKQLKQQQQFLKENLKLNIRVIGIANSRTMAFSENGLDLNSWEATLAEGEKANMDDFFKRIKALNLRNSIFVDNTASAAVSETYAQYLGNNIAVVTCNKIACSSAYENYRELKRLAREYNAPFLFETNVGAGLPILDTLKNLVASGDKVNKIQAVLSGSLNFVFNNFNGDTTFHDVVKAAQEQGYTEPDPKIDLSGVDVMRKILILARESGLQLEISDIENQAFLPQASMDTQDNDSFFASLKDYEDQFQSLFKAADSQGCRLKYVAQLDNGKASVGLQQIPEGHDFYNLEGSDNIVLFYTERYPNQPLIVKGAGAGADVTASGIFADIIRVGNF